MNQTSAEIWGWVASSSELEKSGSVRLDVHSGVLLTFTPQTSGLCIDLCERQRFKHVAFPRQLPPRMAQESQLLDGHPCLLDFGPRIIVIHCEPIAGVVLWCLKGFGREELR